jgi:hypothetical protein
VQPGEWVTIIRRGTDVTVDHTDPTGRSRRFRATMLEGVHPRIIQALRDAGFPEAPRERIPPGSTRVVSAIDGGHEIRTRPIAYHTRAPFWPEAFALFDAIAAQASGSTEGEPVVHGASEVRLFEPSPDMEEPPLGEDANAVVSAAWQVAAERQHLEVTPTHLLVAFVRDHAYQLERLSIDAARVLTAAEALFTWDPEPGEPRATPSFELVPQVARRVAAEAGAHEASLRHLLRALLEAGGADVTRLLQQHRVPDAMLGGNTRDRIFAVPAPSLERLCLRCGALAAEHRWCTQCGRALVAPAPFSTGSPLDHVFPLIEPHDWNEGAGVVSRSLCSLPDQSGTPWLGFQLEAGDANELVTAERLAELGVDAERLERAAIANLGRIPASWTPRWVPAPDGREVDVLFCDGEARGCERILEKPFLLHAQAMLGSNTLAAAVPQRDQLVVTRLADLTVLMSLARHYFDNAERAPVSPWGFAITDGEISGPISAS